MTDRRGRVVLLAATFVLLSAGGHLRSADDVQGLIKQEQAEHDSFRATDADDLPPAALLGDARGVLLYDPAEADDKEGLVCGPLPIEELFDNPDADADVAPAESDVNWDRPRIRSVLEDGCLVRPGDSFLAVGRGWNREVTGQRFVLRPEAAACPEDPPAALWTHFDAPLDEAPLFYLTASTAPEGPNGWIAVDAVSSAPWTAADQARIAAKVRFPDEYDGTVWTSSFTDPSRFFRLVRRTVKGSDDGLPNEVLLADGPSGLQVLWVERVDMAEGSGQARIDGWLDWDRDGVPEVVISGVHATCPYLAVLRSDGGTYRSIGLRPHPCHC